MSLESLPLEILELIYQHMSFADLIILLNVSHSSRQSIQHPRVWNKVTCCIGGGAFRTSRQENPDVSWAKHIKVSNESCSIIADYLYNTRRLNTQNFNDLSFSTASIVFPFFKDLRDIDISNNMDIKDDCITLISHHCARLSKLNVSRCFNLTSQSLLTISISFPTLIWLDISSTRCVTNKSWIVLCAVNENLETIKMASCMLLDWDIVGGILPTSLKHWDISRNCAVDFGYLLKVAEHVITNKQILTVDIRDCESITGQEVESLNDFGGSSLKLLANPLIQNHDSDGIREYLKMILECA